jgi:serine/threonine protein kinase
LKDKFISSKEGDIQNVYEFECQLGSGGFGTVWSATHKELGTKRAIKIIEKGEIEMQESFECELNIAMKLIHPNIIRIFETWETETHYILVMERCEGGELLECVDAKGGLSEDEA